MPIEVHTVQTLQALNPTEKTEGGETQATAGKDTPQSSAPAPEAEQKETEVSEPSETEATEEEAEEPGGADDKDVAAKTGDEANDKPNPSKKKSGIQRRVDKLNGRITAAQQEAEYWKAEALKNATASKPATVDQPKQPAAEGKPNPNDFDTHVEYLDARDEWNKKQTRMEAEKERLQSAQAKATETHATRVKAFADKTPDFQETLENLDDVPNSPAVREIIITSENGPELLYELAKNPDEARRIAKLGPLAAAREMGKIEARLSSSKTSEAKQDPKKISQAPKPLVPVGGSGKAGTPKTLEEAAKSSYADYKRLRAEQIKKRRQA